GQYDVFEAGTLRKAREILTEERVRAVLLDLNLPDGSGFDWISELKEEWPQLVILVITGRGDVPTAVKAMRLGADHFATKPIDVNDLTVILEKCLEIGSLRLFSKIRNRRPVREAPFFGKSVVLQQANTEAQIASESDA